MTGRELLESDALRAFAIFAEHRNFTTAAAALRISQPSLHTKINRLAEGLGVELYHRQGRGLALTEAGERLATFAADSLLRVDDFLAELGEDDSPVRLAAGRATLRWVISPMVRAIARSGHTLRVITADRAGAVRAVVDGHADIAVTALDPPPSTVHSRQIASYPQILVVRSGHPLAHRERVRLRDLDGLDLLVPPPGRPHRERLNLALAEAGADWRVASEVDGWDLLVHLTDLGLGATVVNGCIQLPARLRGIPITDLPKVRYWAIWRDARQRMVTSILEQLEATHG